MRISVLLLSSFKPLYNNKVKFVAGQSITVPYVLARWIV